MKKSNHTMSKLPEYIKMRADELLEAFGKGSHKPGSGSAAAFNGLECSVLLLTVIKLTLKQKAYIESHDALNEIKAKINKTIYPTLIELFQTDAEEFHKVISLRNKKKNHKKNIIKLDLQRRIEIESKLIEAIKNATRIPIQIANLCIELAQYALQVYDIGWKAVRGDTGVAISNALSALAGCNYIISLNLLSVQGDDLDAMLMETDLQRLNSEYTKLNSNAYSKFNHLSTELETKYNFQYFLKEKQVDKEEYRKLQDTDIEKLANQILNELWDKKNKLWKIKIPTKEINVINTKKVLENMGFQLFTEETLGVTDYEHHEIGGIMNRELKVVLTSSLHKPVVKNFTAAHELGHVLLHTDNILFRDVPLNGEIRRHQKSLKKDKLIYLPFIS